MDRMLPVSKQRYKTMQNYMIIYIHAMHAYIYWPFSYTSKSISCISCESVKGIMQTAVRYPGVAYFRDKTLRLTRSLHRDTIACQHANKYVSHLIKTSVKSVF